MEGACGEHSSDLQGCVYWNADLYACLALPVLLIFLARVTFLACAKWHAVCVALHRQAQLVCGALRQVGRGASLENPKVGREVLQIRLKAASKLLISLTAIFVFYTVLVLCLPTQKEEALTPSAAIRWTTLLSFTGCTMYALFPGLLRVETLNVFYAFFTLIGLLVMSPFHVSPEVLLRAKLITLVLLRLPLLLLATRLWVVALGNLAFLIIIVARSRLQQSSDDYMRLAPQMECLIFLSTIFIAKILQALMKNRAEVTVEQGKMATQLTAASSLLKLTCDAVVELDRNLLLTAHSPELAAMLLRDRPGSTLKGAKFTEFMPAAEAARATQLLGADSVASQRANEKAFITAHAFHTKLVDSYASKLCTEVFQVRYTRADGEICSLLGLREFTDATSLAGRNAMDAYPEHQRSGAGEPLPTSPTTSLPVSPWMSASDDGIDDNLHEGPPRRGRQSFLDIDMEGVLVHAASADLHQAVGMSVMELFPAQHTVELLRRLYDEAMFVTSRGEDPPKRLFSYKDLPVRWASGKTSRISGSMEVMCNRYGRVNVLMAFVEHGESFGHRRSSEKAVANLRPALDKVLMTL